MTRRGLMRRGSAATVAAIGVGAGAHHTGTGPVGDVEAIAPAALVAGAAISYTGAGAVGYMAYKNAKKFLGNNDDMSGFTGYDALHQSIVAGAKEMQSADERVMTSIENNITHSDNVALAKGKAAIIKEMNNGNGESAAQTAMQEAIDGYYADIQENIITHFAAQYDQVTHHLNQIRNHENTPSEFPIEVLDRIGDNWWSADAGPAGHVISQGEIPQDYSKGEFTTSAVSLLDGRSVEYPRGDYNDSGNDFRFGFAVTLSHCPQYAGSDGTLHGLARVAKPDGSGHVEYLDCKRYADAWDAIITKRDDVNAQLSGFVSDVYAEYSAGEIPTEDLVDPITAATELDAGYDGYQTQAAHAAMMGIPTNAEQTLTLEIEGDEGGTSTVGADIYTEHVPTDADGNEVGFQPGTTYEPSTWSEPLYVSYSYVETDEESGEVTNEEQDFVQLENPFTVVEAYDKEGNEVESFAPESRNNQTADVTAIEDELAQIRDEQIAMQEEAEEEMNSGGGGGGGIVDDLIGGNPAVGAVVAVVAGGALLQIAKSFTE